MCSIATDPIDLPNGSLMMSQGDLFAHDFNTNRGMQHKEYSQPRKFRHTFPGIVDGSSCARQQASLYRRWESVLRPRLSICENLAIRSPLQT